MSGSKAKNGKKNKSLTIPEVIQVKSVKLETNKTKNDRKTNTRSEDNLRNHRKKFQNKTNLMDEATNLETSCLVNAFMNLSLNSEGEHITASTSSIDEATNAKDVSDNLPLVMQYCPENGDDLADKEDEKCCNTYQYFAKNNKCIKFTNQVTVLYFNGEDVLCESMEPLKKEQEQQLRNKEMRKEHLLTKGQIDNVYLT